jgi:hypothetical protein
MDGVVVGYLASGRLGKDVANYQKFYDERRHERVVEDLKRTEERRAEEARRTRRCWVRLNRTDLGPGPKEAPIEVWPAIPKEKFLDFAETALQCKVALNGSFLEPEPEQLYLVHKV